MTNVELYDLALAKGIKEPAVFRHGDLCYLGEWVDMKDAALFNPANLMFVTSTRAVRVFTRASDWKVCAQGLGWAKAEEGPRCEAYTLVGLCDRPKGHEGIHNGRLPFPENIFSDGEAFDKFRRSSSYGHDPQTGVRERPLEFQNVPGRTPVTPPKPVKP